ncbi:alpha/beta-hydrolase [Ganoderma leucocontextum]|nr:alpha/beta-hydrolase [Ganoderma leucocontextum]
MPFAFRHQPVKTVYLLGAAVYVLGALPVWTVANALPSTRPRRSWTLKRSLVVTILRNAAVIIYSTSLQAPPTLEACEKDAHALGFVWVKATPDLVVGEVHELAEKNGVEAVPTAGFWIGPRGPDGNSDYPAGSDEKVVYHFHGGGHVSGTAHPKGGSAPLYEGYLEHFGKNVRIFGLEYRLSSAAPLNAENPFPASLIDAIAGYRYLVEDIGFHPSRIVLSGDSAGGGIALNLARYLAMAKLPSLPVPNGLILLSPTMDWAGTHVGPKSSVVRNASSDFVPAIIDSQYTKYALLGRLPEEMAEQSLWISPGSLKSEWHPGMFAGLPPTIVVTGDAEYTLDPMITARDRLLEDIGKERVTHVDIPDAAHDPVIWKWHEPERSTILQELASWIKTVW